MRMRVFPAIAAASALLAACGGGSTSNTLPAPAPAPTTPARSTASAKATFVVKIPPKKTSSNRRPSYLTPDVQGIDFTVTQNNGSVGAGYVFYALTPQQSYCQTPSGGGLTCTLDVAALPGDDTFVVNTYDTTGLNASRIISTGTLEQTINADASNTVNIVTSGVPSFFAVAADNPYPAAALTQSVHALVLDADGNVIVGPYDTPVVVQNSDASGATSLSATSLASSTDAAALTLAYTGASVSPLTITLSSNSPDAMGWNGTSSGTLNFQPNVVGVLASPSYLIFDNTSASPQTITLSGTGTTAPLSADTNPDTFGDQGLLTPGKPGYSWYWENGCQNIASVSGTAPTFTVTPVHSGICYLDLYDAAGHYGALPIVVQQM